MANPFNQMPKVFGQHPVTGGGRTGSSLPMLAGKPVTIWHDATDISQLWQDLAMTVPITANGQIIEAISDKGSEGYHLDAPAIPVPAVGKPTYQALATGGLSAMAFDRTFNGNIGQMIRSLDFTKIFPLPYFALHVGNWQVPGFGFSALFVHAVEDALQGLVANGISIASGDSDSFQSNIINGDFAGWLHNDDFLNNACSVNNTAGVAASATGSADVYIINDPNNIALGGNRNGGAGNSGWHGTISEYALWQGVGNIPTEAAVEAYVTGKYGLTWL